MRVPGCIAAESWSVGHEPALKAAVIFTHLDLHDTEIHKYYVSELTETATHWDQCSIKPNQRWVHLDAAPKDI